ncbi:nuclear transport factor 2 family protein [candidate division KSB1 bacterium]|nr:nuclear transport factor 2 family protein [candidate division KSB1 bacterium]
MKQFGTFALCGLICIALGCQSTTPIDMEAEKESVHLFIKDFWQAFETKDIDAFSEMVAHEPDMVFFGTDENEYWAGWNAIKDAVERQFKAFYNIDVKYAAEVIHVSEAGKTAWFSLIRTIQVTNQKGEKQEMKNRVTGVLIKKHRAWKLVQYHSSAALNWDLFKY